LGGILFPIRGYLNTGDKVVVRALIIVALLTIGIEGVVYSLDDSYTLHAAKGLRPPR